MNDYNLSYF